MSLGDLVADQAIDIVLRLTFPYGQLGRDTGLIVRVLDREGAFEAADVRDARLSWTWADDAANDVQPRDTDVDRAVARQFAARARQEAVQRNRAGDFDEARQVLDATAKRIRKYAAATRNCEHWPRRSWPRRRGSPRRCRRRSSSRLTSERERRSFT